MKPEHDEWVRAYEHAERLPMFGRRPPDHHEEDDDMRTTGGSARELPPEAMHVARCCRVIDLGTQVNRKFGKRQHLGWVFFELPNTSRQGGKPGDAIDPFIIGKRYQLSHHEKSNLRLDLESWYGKRFDGKVLDDAGGFDLTKLIGRPALLNVVHSEDGQYANIVSVNPLPAGMTCPPAVMPTIVFDLERYDARVFEELSEGLKEQIRGSEEWQAINHGHGRQPGPSQAGAPPADDDPITRKAAPPSSYQAPGAQSGGGGKFDDMPDDIPF
jgi:hypothetical protein